MTDKNILPAGTKVFITNIVGAGAPDVTLGMAGVVVDNRGCYEVKFSEEIEGYDSHFYNYDQVAEMAQGLEVEVVAVGTAPAVTLGMTGVLTGKRWGEVQPRADAVHAEWLAVDFGYCEGIWWYDPVCLKPAKPKVAKPRKVKVKPVKAPKVKPVKVGLAALYPQTRKVLTHLQKYGTISPLEAFGVYRITRLAARIKELRDAGYKVITDMKQDATGTKYASYTLSAA